MDYSHIPMMLPLSSARLSHIFITVSDHDSMVSFYRDQLGLVQIACERGRFAFFDIGNNCRIALYPGRSPVEAAAPHWFIVLDVDDIDRTRSSLVSRGITVSAIESVPFGRAATFSDPEGNIIEIHQPAD